MIHCLFEYSYHEHFRRIAETSPYSLGKFQSDCDSARVVGVSLTGIQDESMMKCQHWRHVVHLYIFPYFPPKI